MGIGDETVTDGTQGLTTTLGRTDQRIAIVNGSTAGAHTLTGIAVGDIIIQVVAVDFAINSGTPADDDPIDVAGFDDQTDEWTITGANEITSATTNNTDAILFVIWAKRSASSDETAVA